MLRERERAISGGGGSGGGGGGGYPRGVDNRVATAVDSESEDDLIGRYQLSNRGEDPSTNRGGPVTKKKQATHYQLAPVLPESSATKPPSGRTKEGDWIFDGGPT